jgi:hypothetical protein
MKTTTPSSNDDSPNEPCRPTKNITSQTAHSLKVAILIGLIGFSSPLAMFAQVDKIKDKVSEDKSSSGNKAQAQQYSGGGGDDDGYDWSADFTESLVANAVIGVFYGIYYVGKVGQRYAMDKSEQHPELLSIELTGQALIDINEGTIRLLAHFAVERRGICHPSTVLARRGLFRIAQQHRLASGEAAHPHRKPKN